MLRFFPEEEEEEEEEDIEGNEKEEKGNFFFRNFAIFMFFPLLESRKKHKPIRLNDYVRQQLLEKGATA